MTQKIKPGILDEDARWRPVNRVAISALVAVGVAIGVLPYALFANRWQLALPVAAALVAFVGSLLRLRTTRSPATETPTLGEYALGGWSLMATSSSISLTGIGFYWLIRGMLWILAAMAGWFGGAFQPDPRFWGLGLSMAWVVFAAIFYPLDAARDMAGKLFPNVAGARSLYFSLLAERRRLLMAGAGSAVALVLLVAVFPPPGKSFAFGLAVLLVYSGIAVDAMGRTAPRISDKKRVLKAISRILEAIGYEVVPSPRTGDPAVDPLITTTDLLAHSPARALVMEVKYSPKKGQPVEWHEAARLHKAARKLRAALWGSDSHVEVLPVLMLVGRPRAESLKRYLVDEPMEVLEPDGFDWIERAQLESDASVLESLAGHLGLEAVDPYPAELASGEEAG